MLLPNPSDLTRKPAVWRVLLVSDQPADEPWMRQLLSQARNKNLVLEWSASYEEGSERLAAGAEVAALVVKYDLGSQRALAAIRKALARPDPTPVLVLCSQETYAADQAAQEAGAADYLCRDQLNPVILERALLRAVRQKKDVHPQWNGQAQLSEADTALQESENRLRAIFNNLHSIMLLINPDSGQILDANQAACSFYGYSHAQLCQMRITDINTLPQDQTHQKMSEAGETTSSRDFHFQHRLASGEIRDVDVHSGPILFNNEKVLFSIIYDITEHKKTEKALHESEARYRTFFANLKETVTLFQAVRDQEGEIVDWLFLDMNPCAREQFSLDESQVLGKTIGQVLGPQALSAVSAEYAQVLATGEPSVRETRDQDQFFLTTVFRMDETTVASSGLDITARKQAEAARAYQAMLLANVHDAVIATDAQNTITLWNKNAERVSGLSAAEAVGKNFYEVVNRKDATLAEREADRKQIEEKGILVTEYTFLTRDGRPIIMESVNIALRSAEGEPTGYLITSRDITERKRMEQALKDSEAELRRKSEALAESVTREQARAAELEALMNAVPAIIWVTHDPQCKEMYGNRSGYEFLRMQPGENLSKSASAEQLAQQTHQIMRDGRVIPADQLPMQISAATGKPVQDYEFDLVFDDGAAYHLLGNTTPLFDPFGNPAGAIGAFVDITALRRLQVQQIEALAQMEVQRRLMEYREMERQGIARDIHDGPIQTLASTAFHIQFVKEAYSDPTLHLELEQIGQAVKNTVRELRDIVNDLRPPSLIRFGLTRAIRMHSEDIRERHPELEIELDLVEESNRLSEQACLTLFRIYQEGLNNIIHHAGATTVWVTYQEDEDWFMLELHDNGKGFPVTHDLSQLTKEGHFGLAGMKERGETIGGEFSIFSQPDRGTTITVRGPLLGKNIKPEKDLSIDQL